jgi:hypothetical protein
MARGLMNELIGSGPTLLRLGELGGEAIVRSPC